MAAAGPVTEEGVVVSLAGEANQGGWFWRPSFSPRMVASRRSVRLLVSSCARKGPVVSPPPTEVHIVERRAQDAGADIHCRDSPLYGRESPVAFGIPALGPRRGASSPRRTSLSRRWCQRSRSRIQISHELGIGASASLDLRPHIRI